jgi:hypothetical protein
MRNGVIPFVILLAAGGCATSPSVSTDKAIAQDVTCMAAAGDASAASDPMERNFAPVMLAYYLGRLEQSGLSDDDIEARVEKVAMNSAAEPSQATVVACRDAFSGRISAMHATQRRTLAKLQAGTREQPKK